MNIYKTFGNLWKNKENDDANRLLLEAPDKLTKKKYAFNNNNKSNWLLINSLQLYKCTLEENLFTSSHRAHVAENQTQALTTLADLQ